MNSYDGGWGFLGFSHLQVKYHHQSSVSHPECHAKYSQSFLLCTSSNRRIIPSLRLVHFSSSKSLRKGLCTRWQNIRNMTTTIEVLCNTTLMRHSTNLRLYFWDISTKCIKMLTNICIEWEDLKYSVLIHKQTRNKLLYLIL